MLGYQRVDTKDYGEISNKNIFLVKTMSGPNQMFFFCGEWISSRATERWPEEFRQMFAYQMMFP